MKTDLEIAQEAVMEPIGRGAEKLGMPWSCTAGTKQRYPTNFWTASQTGRTES